MSAVRIGADDTGTRLDRWLRRELALESLSAIYRLIRKGMVKVNGKRRSAGYRLNADDTVEFAASAGAFRISGRAAAEARGAVVDTAFFRRNFRLLYEDENLMACDKPSNLVVHSGTGHLCGDSLIELASHYLARHARGAVPRQPFLVHRLDKDTSGVILIAKDRATVRALHESFRARSLTKRYVAFCHGRPSTPSGVVDVGLSRSYLRHDGTKVFVSERGRRSESRYRTVSVRNDVARVEVELYTGRTHQIRVHMAHLSCPVVGDVRYGDRQRDARIFGRPDACFRRLYLHAYSISFFHPAFDRSITVEAAEPGEFSQLWESL